MGGVSSTSANSLKHIEWIWQSNTNAWSESEPAEWSHYSDVENLIIEEAFSKKQPQVILDDYYIDFKDNLQISNIGDPKQRPIKRVVREREDKDLRKERFMDVPIASTHSFGGQYGWISPFVIEVRRDLDLQSDELPSKKKNIIPMLVEKAACGIIEEGKHIGKQQEADRNRQKATELGNTLLIMDVLYGFTADLRGLSEYPDEEEELITPGVCFCVRRVEFDCTTNKHFIHMELRQIWS
ncbi:unnamed protein product, partial [Rotaria sp. Silwood1]